MVQVVRERGWTMGCGVKVSNRIPTYMPIVEFFWWVANRFIYLFITAYSSMAVKKDTYAPQLTS